MARAGGKWRRRATKPDSSVCDLARTAQLWSIYVIYDCSGLQRMPEGKSGRLAFVASTGPTDSSHFLLSRHLDSADFCVVVEIGVGEPR